MQQTIDIQKLATEIARQQHKQLLNFNDLCAIMGYAPNSSTVRKIVNSLGFPKSVKLTECADRRWFKTEVFSWLESQRKTIPRLS